MLSTSLLSASLIGLAAAGNVCLSSYKNSFINEYTMTGAKVFSKTSNSSTAVCGGQFLDLGESPISFCDSLPLEIDICGSTKAAIIEVPHAGPVDDFGGCGIQLDINGTVYGGRRLYGGDENHRECNGLCDIFGPLAYQEVSGQVIFEGVPICDGEQVATFINSTSTR